MIDTQCFVHAVARACIDIVLYEVKFMQTGTQLAGKYIDGWEERLNRT